ncbi:MAG: tRNA-intron lyase [Sulfolobales archaeon]
MGYKVELQGRAFLRGFERSYEAIVVGARSLVFDPEGVEKIYSAGFYGKPFGVKKPKPGVRYKGPLELSMLETLYLCEKGVLRLIMNGSEIGCEDFRRYASKIMDGFEPQYLVYRDLRDRGYVVRSGMKYGVAFAVYEKGPGYEHAPYLVDVMEIEESIDPIMIVRTGRLSHSVRKTLIYAIVGKSGDIRYIGFKWIKF